MGMRGPVPLRPDPDASLRRETLDAGREVLVIDDFLLEPLEARALALARAGEFSRPEGSYPGRVLALRDDETDPIRRYLARRLARACGFARGGLELGVLLSLTTAQPEAFNWLQRLPHTDPPAAAGRANYAGVLYLFDDPALGGTAFYRWRDEDFLRSVQRRCGDDEQRALRLLAQRFPEFSEPSRYVTGSTSFAELLLHVPARFNRLLFYPGDVPHSAWIEAPERLADDPGSGRLTLNLFASVVRP